MFCYNCGTKIEDYAKFCYNCGTSISTNVTTPISSPANNASNGEYDREAMKIYVQNIRNLECIIDELESENFSIQQEINTINRKNIIKVPLANKYIFLKYNGSNFCVLVDEYGCVESAYEGSNINDHEFSKCKWRSIEHNIDYLKRTEGFAWIYFGRTGKLIETEKTKRVAREKAMNDFFELYSKYKLTEPENYRIKTADLFSRKDLINSELEKAKNLLEDAYNINIIPQQFRNIHAIYFICDFISTSNETLTTALLHCDLEEIKEKLDTIIEQQREIIVGQAILAAQNSQIMEQNQRMLNNLANIEQNTDRAAKYSQIAANNSETCVWLTEYQMLLNS